MAACQLKFSVSALVVAMIVAASPNAAADDGDKGIEYFEKHIRPVLVDYCYECHSSEADEPAGGLRLDHREGMHRGGELGPAVVPEDPDESLILSALRYENLEMPPDETLDEAIVEKFQKWIEMGAPDPRSENPEPSPLPKRENTSPTELWSLEPVVQTAAPPVNDRNWIRNDIDRFVLSQHETHGLQHANAATPHVLLRRLSFALRGLPPSAAALTSATGDTADQVVDGVVDDWLESPQFGERWARHWLDVVRYGESAGSSRDVLMLYSWRYRDYVIDAFNADMPWDQFIREQIAGDLLPFESEADRRRQLIATGLLAIGSKSLNGGNLALDLADDQIDVVSKSVMGLTVSCARCHDHKFDPIPTADYYALAGIFRNTRTWYGGSTKRPKNAKSKAAAYFSLDDDGALAFAVQDLQQPKDWPIQLRGEKKTPGNVVPRGFLSCVTLSDGPQIPRNESGRRQLAEWLTAPDHPLTSRVAVNRVWQHLFGHGLVETVDNFGASGRPPSHPKLLDWMAYRFVHHHKWSVKSLVREIVTSGTWQQSSEFNQDNWTIDPDNVFLWRANRQRLEAEAIRDAMLTVSGTINLERPTGSLVQRIGEGEVGRNIKTDILDERFLHRSVYLPIIRGLLPEILKVFDFPEPSNPQGQRSVTNVPTQSLFLMNDPFVIEQSTLLADRVLKSSTDRTAQINFAWQTCLGRKPSESEVVDATTFLNSATVSPDANPRSAWALLCHALMASAEFRFIE
jgi:Protein of unknown function (DUF1553)/Protein of unknown function (DUF1549)/Planctomycete cytochrome C